VAVAIARLELCQISSRGEKTGPNPTDRAKLGTKRHILTDKRGTPLSAVITSANTHDMKAAFETLDATVVRRPRPRRYHRQHLCLDKGYDYQEIESGVISRGYVPHMRHRGELENPREAIQTEEVGRGEERVLAQQVQEAPHQVGEEERELSRTRPASVLDHSIQEDNFGIGS
jgi:Transposase DDE domain